jgi:hypothetical protein
VDVDSARRRNSFTFPLPPVASIPSRLPASPSRTGHEPSLCDQRALPSWNPRLICFPVASHGACDKSVKVNDHAVLIRHRDAGNAPGQGNPCLSDGIMAIEVSKESI